VLLVIGLLIAATGCDGAGSKQDSLYNQLTGTWQVQRVQLDGSTITLKSDVRIEFLQQGGRRYQIARPAAGDTTRRGRIDLPRSDILSMTTGFARPLLWRFDFEEPEPTSTSVRLRLESNWQGSSQAFLDAIGIGGGAQTLAVDLQRE
jgi:hypothetical protein